MAKESQQLTVRCGGCDKIHGVFTKKDMPKQFICGFCSLAQKTEIHTNVGFYHRRNYPEGFFENGNK